MQAKIRPWLAPVLILLLSLGLTGCASTRSFERSGDGAVTYLDSLNPGQKVAARQSIVESLQRGLKSYRLGIGDEIEVLFHFSERPTDQSYIIAVGDTLTIDFLYDSDNNRTVTVRPDGNISLPLVGGITVAGLTAEELGRRLKEAYQDTLVTPVVTVNVSDFSTPLDEFGEAIGTTEAGRSKVISVTPDGTVSLPLLPQIRALGLTVDDLQDMLDTAYRAIGLNVTVSLLPRTTRSARIMVFGEVRDPGPLVVNRPQTVLMAIASAGGVLPSGSMESVKLFYVGTDSQPRVRSVNLVNVLEKLQLEEDMIVPDNSVIYVPPTELAKVGRFLDATLGDILRYNGASTSLGFSYILNQNQGSGEVLVTP